VLVGQPALDLGALAHRDALPDHEVGGGLVRGVEADRSQVLVLRLEGSDDRVALPDPWPARAVVVKRQRPSRLRLYLLDLVRSCDVALDEAISVLPQVDRGARLPTLDGKDHQENRARGSGGVSTQPGSEATREVLCRIEMERSARLDGEGAGHARSLGGRGGLTPTIVA